MSHTAVAGITTTSPAGTLAINFLNWGRSAVAPLMFSR
jgi:hypothetical protein